MTKHDTSEALKVAAQRLGLVDLDWLKIVDTSKVTLEADGTVKGADELIAALRAAKPFLFQQKRAADMTPAEKAAFWREVKRGPKPEPMPIDKTAREMTPAERDTFLKECARRAR